MDLATSGWHVRFGSSLRTCVATGNSDINYFCDDASLRAYCETEFCKNEPITSDVPALASGRLLETQDKKNETVAGVTTDETGKQGRKVRKWRFGVQYSRGLVPFGLSVKKASNLAKLCGRPRNKAQ